MTLADAKHAAESFDHSAGEVVLRRVSPGLWELRLTGHEVAVHGAIEWADANDYKVTLVDGPTLAIV